MLQKIVTSIAVITGVLTSSSLAKTPVIAQSRPTVVATTSVICDLTQQIAGDTVELKCLGKSGIDPHLYQPTPDDRKAVDKSQLILYGGYDFEPGLIKLIQASSNSAPKIAVFEKAVPASEVRSQKSEVRSKTKHGNKEGDSPDPHVWHNAQNGGAMVEVISNSLENLAPANAAKYQSQEEKLTKEIKQIDGWIKSQVETIPPDKRKLVTTHDALGYYADAYGLTLEGALQGLSTDTAPTAQRVADLVKKIKATGVQTIFAESTTNPKLIQQVAKEANVKVSDQELYADGLGEKGSSADTYQKMLTSNTKAIVEGLGGKYTPFVAK